MKYFNISELIHSAKAQSLGIDNTPSADIIANIKKLIEKLLNPAREAFGAPIYVTSGYRSPILNKAVGGARNSYHMKGRAADLSTGSRAGNLRLYSTLSTMPHTELINEHNGTWIHVAL